MAVIDSNKLVWSGLVDEVTCGELKKAIELCTVKDLYTKADMAAMLEDLDLQIDESAAYNLEVAKVQRMIRDRIVKLKAGARNDLKTLEQEPSEDAVSREEVKEQMLKYGFHAPDMTVTEFVEDLPSVNPRPKTGHWVSEAVQGEIDGQIVKVFTCSECGAISIFRMTGGEIVNGNLCPNCGAKMIKPQESEG